MADLKTGTREWSEHSFNIQRGCEHGCRYCYARYNAVDRFKRCSLQDWARPIINQKKVDKKTGRYDGIVMFPTQHDITPKNISECLCVLHKLLDAGNRVLIVSKPHWECITVICEALGEYRWQLMFRFTIGSKDDEVLKFWEPNAPGFKERLACLKYAYFRRYITSVSCEPYLDADVVNLFLWVKPYITDSFWIGKLRDFERRVDTSGITPEQDEKFVRPMKAAQTDESVRKIYDQLNTEKLVKWKDSVRKVIR
jgi:hypothetical protein